MRPSNFHSNASRRDDDSCHDISLSRSSDSGQVPRSSPFLARPLPVAIQIPQALMRRRTEICKSESETLFKNGKISGSSESQNLQLTTLDIIDEVLALLEMDVDELLMAPDLPLK